MGSSKAKNKNKKKKNEIQKNGFDPVSFPLMKNTFTRHKITI